MSKQLSEIEDLLTDELNPRILEGYKREKGLQNKEYTDTELKAMGTPGMEDYFFAVVYREPGEIMPEATFLGTFEGEKFVEIDDSRKEPIRSLEGKEYSNVEFDYVDILQDIPDVSEHRRYSSSGDYRQSSI